jgi:hypothetical protein
MRKIAWSVLALVLALFTSVAVVWQMAYPSESDPKNIKYVLWKNGLYRMNLDSAAETMMGDSGNKELVIGKTKSQLQQRFGYLLTPANTSQYLRNCYQNSSWKNRDVLFIRKTSLMLVFDGDKAIDLVLVKGC